MANKWMKKLGMGLSAVMLATQMSGLAAMAAPEDDNSDWSEDVE